MSTSTRKHKGKIRLSNLNFYSHRLDKDFQGFGVSYDVKNGGGGGPCHDEKELLGYVGHVVVGHPDHIFEVIDERSPIEPERPEVLELLDNVEPKEAAA